MHTARKSTSYKQNPGADALAKMAAERKPAPNGIFINDLTAPSARENPSTVHKTRAEETKHAEKAENAPTDPAPDQTPGGPQCLAPLSPTKAKQTTRTGDPTYWLTSSTKSSLRNKMQLAGSPDEPKHSP